MKKKPQENKPTENTEGKWYFVFGDYTVVKGGYEPNTGGSIQQPVKCTPDDIRNEVYRQIHQKCVTKGDLGGYDRLVINITNIVVL